MEIPTKKAKNADSIVRHAAAGNLAQQGQNERDYTPFEDERKEAISQRKIQDLADDSTQARSTARSQQIADEFTARSSPPIQHSKNTTGLPDALKSGIERLSGYAMDDVEVHFNSSAPGQMNAHAFAQGPDIHLAPGQEKHLPHEAWHVVQQKQGRVAPTHKLKNQININSDQRLESEADLMGSKAERYSSTADTAPLKPALSPSATETVQRKIGFEFEDSSWEVYQNLPEEMSEEEDDSQHQQENADYQDEEAEENYIQKVRILEKDENKWPSFITEYFNNVPEFLALREGLEFSVFDSELDFVGECFRRVYGSDNFAALIQKFHEAEKQEASDFGQFVQHYVWEIRKIVPWIAGLLSRTFKVKDYKVPLTDSGQIVVFPSMAKQEDPNHIDSKMAKYNMKAAPKVWAIHKKNQYALETDGPYANGKMDIEIVTKPFPLTEQGYNLLVSTFSTVESEIITVLKKYGGKRKALKGEFVTPQEHGFTNVNAYLAEGETEPKFKMQVTHGVSLANIPSLMRYFGAAQQGEGILDRARRSPARRFAHGKGSPDDNEVAIILGRTPALAATVMGSLVGDGIFQQTDDTKALQGFVSYMLMYIQGLSKTSFKGIKESIPFLSRFSMATLFEKLPDNQKNPLKQADGMTALVKAIDAVMPKDVLGTAIDADGERKKRSMMNVGDMFVAKNGAPHKVAFYKLIRMMTVEEWVRGICGGVDFLTKNGIVQYFAGKQIDVETEGYKRGLEIFLRGHADTSNVVAAENQQEESLAVMENRFIAPTSNNAVSFEAVRSGAKSYFKFIKQVNELNGQANAGKFRKVRHLGN